MVLYNPSVCLSYAVFIYFDYFPVIGHKAVHFDFHIGCLCVDGAYEPVVGQLVKEVCVAYIAVCQFCRRLAVDITELPVWGLDVSVDNHADAAILAEHVGTLGVVDMGHRG